MVAAAGAVESVCFFATRDPLPTDDVTQGVLAGYEWVNTTLGGSALWKCVSNAAGAAVWGFDGSKLGDPEPSGVKTQAGGAARGSVLGSFAEEGNIYRNVGNPIAGNGVDTTDDILDGFQLPISVFDVANRGLTLSFFGKFAATANNKRLKVWANPTMANQTVNANGSISGGQVTAVGAGALLYDSGVVTSNNLAWKVLLNIFKYGAAGSNTQMSIDAESIIGTVHGGVALAAPLTLPENAAINIVVTGSSPTTGAANDVVSQWTEGNWMN